MDLTTLFAQTFESRANEVALEWACQEYTFRDLDARASRMASVLAARGLSAGDRLALFLSNRIEYIDLFVAATRLGIIVVPINILYREREAGHILRDAQPKALVVSGAVPFDSDVDLWQVDELTARARTVVATPSRASLTGDTPAALVYTSGTTGAAKGAIVTHASLAANALTLVDAWRITAQDRFLLALPLFHVHGLGNGIHSWLRAGCRMRLLERFDHSSASATLLDFRPTLFFGVPTMYVRLLDVEPGAAREIGRSLRLAVSGSAPLPTQVLEGFERLYGQRILERYGMTETLMTLGNPYDAERRAGTVGLPFRGVEARIVNEHGDDVAIGTVGELIVKSPMLFAGYWGQPELTAKAFSDGWFHTGDLAMQSGDGYYTLCGRRSDLIISGGFNIYPREIEELLCEHPAVAEAAVAGAPDPLRGEVPMGFVVLADHATASELELIDFCRARLASFKIPRAIRFVDRLPRTALGKVQKAALVQSL